MKKYKIAVYAISKNEEKFVDRWVTSMNEADQIFVLDTGSTDNTVEKLKKHGVVVEKKEITPWRFDVARNISLEMVPEDYDICVCTDLDEVLIPGWRETLEKLWEDSLTRLRYHYNWSFDENGNPSICFYIEKIHCRNGFKWTHPVHEILSYDGKELMKTTDDIIVNHYPDSTKSRASYLPLLELSVEESPMDDRNVHYLGREYMFYGRWNECIDTLIRHLSLPTAIWKDERAASMRFIARSYQALNRYEEAKMWLEKAIKEAPHLRDALVERALLAYKQSNFEEVIKYCNEALKITSHEKTYINEPFSFDHTIYDLLSIAYYELGNIKESKENIDIALTYLPKDERLLKNKEIIDNTYNKEVLKINK